MARALAREAMNHAGGKLTMFVVLGLLLIMTVCQTVELDDDSVEGDLNVIVQTRHIPAELSITYSDMHGLWGGTKITINGAGSAEIQERDSGEPLPRTLKNTLDRDQDEDGRDGEEGS